MHKMHQCSSLLAQLVDVGFVQATVGYFQYNKPLYPTTAVTPIINRRDIYTAGSSILRIIGLDL